MEFLRAPKIGKGWYRLFIGLLIFAPLITLIGQTMTSLAQTGPSGPVWKSWLPVVAQVDSASEIARKRITPTATRTPVTTSTTTQTPPTATPLPSANYTIYGDQLSSLWADWSYGGVTRGFANPSPVHGGTASIAVTFTSGWSGFKLGDYQGFSLAGYTALQFYIHGGAAGKQAIVISVSSTQGGSITQAVAPQAGTWAKVVVPLAGLDPQAVYDLMWFNNTGGAQPVFYLDDIIFVGGNNPPTSIPTNTAVPSGTPGTPPPSGLSLSVNAATGNHAISPYIYGMNFANESLAAELSLPVDRWGGNAVTRYNWQYDTSNRASDWFFENIPNDNANPGQLPNGSASDKFVEQDRRTGAQSLLTIPLIGWTPASRGYACGFSVQKYGAQQSTDSWRPDCGNGVRPDGTKITGNDPHDTSIEASPAFVQDWIRHLVGLYGTAGSGGVRFYDLDNEPMLWNSTHRDVHPNPTSYDEIRDRTYQYASALKAVDPTAQTLGPVLWGWTAYFYSALDSAPGGSWWNNPQDRMAHGNVPFVDWYLQQMKAYEQAHGARILDYLDLHYYPQASGVALSSAGNATTQALRLRSTRGLWDASYTDESWINEPVRLIPRMRDWVQNNYPGTKLAITEYNWGALDDINGALTEADVLGIFGREGLDVATLWAPPTATQPGSFAFRMYLNYDGSGGRFGDVSVTAASTNQDQLSVYAAKRASDGALTVLVINKTGSSLTSPVNLSNFTSSGTARVYRYSTANLSAITALPNQTVGASGFTATFPANSITLFVVLP